MDNETLIYGAIWYGVFIVSITLHEAAHAFVALRLGDRTAYLGGQVSLNPLPHIKREPVGTIIVPLVTFYWTQYNFMIGWASAPYDPRWAHRYPRRAAIMGLAGPFANLLLLVLAVLLLKLGVSQDWFRVPFGGQGFTRVVIGVGDEWTFHAARAISILFSLNLLLFALNLLPFPPLDGSSVFSLILPTGLARHAQALLGNPLLWIVGMVAGWILLSRYFYGSVFAPSLELLRDWVL